MESPARAQNRAPDKPETAGGDKRTAPPTPVWRDRALLILLSVAVVGLVLQITLGGVVRVTGSGDGCPDWPQCFGRWYPPFEYHAILEYSHRSVGSLVGLVIIAATVRVWIKHRDARVVAWLATTCLALIAVVGGIGGAVVLNELDPAIRTVHLMLAEIVAMLAVLALVAATYGRPISDSATRNAGPDGKQGRSSPWVWGRVSDEHRSALNLAAVAAVLTLVALLSGSYAVWRDAGGVCASWPLCGGSIIPESGLAWVHMTHRVLSLVSIVTVLFAGHRAGRLPNASGALRAAALGSAVLIVAQMLMGAANPWTTFAQWARAGHLSMATLVWVDMVFVVALILRPVPRKERELAGMGREQAREPTLEAPEAPGPV